MKSRIRLLPVFFYIIITGCKEEHPPANPTYELENKVVEDSTLLNRNDIADLSDQDFEKEEENHLLKEFTYTPFDKKSVLEYLNLEILMEDRNLENLLSATLRPGDSLRSVSIPSGDGTFNTFLLRAYREDIVEFYIEGGRISLIKIVNSAGVPDNMIRPGLPYEELKKTYVNPVAYGSEVDASVYIPVEDIIFGMATSYGLDEPIEIEDDIEILWIQF